MTTETQPAQPQMPPIKVAFIIDDKVVDVLHTDDRLAAIFLSEPIMVDVTDLFTQEKYVYPGDLYDSETKAFSRVIETTTPTE